MIVVHVVHNVRVVRFAGKLQESIRAASKHSIKVNIRPARLGQEKEEEQEIQEIYADMQLMRIYAVKRWKLCLRANYSMFDV